MAHFANVGNDSIVTAVLVIPDEQEHRGAEFLNDDLGLPGTWVQTSYTSRNGQRVDPVTNELIPESIGFRYNFAGIGFTWDPNFGDDGAFIPPKPESNPSFVVDPLTATWIPPIPMPDTDGLWNWDEDLQEWVEASAGEDGAE